MAEVPAWLLATLGVVIVAVELAAILTRKRGDTISERLRALLGSGRGGGGGLSGSSPSARWPPGSSST
jgi:hypothetical protein